MKEALVSWLLPLADLCTRFFQTIPLFIAQVILISVMAGLGLWVITLKEENPKTFPVAAQRESAFTLFHDLRFWALVLLLLQSIFIIVFQ